MRIPRLGVFSATVRLLAKGMVNVCAAVVTVVEVKTGTEADVMPAYEKVPSALAVGSIVYTSTCAPCSVVSLARALEEGVRA